MAHASTLLFAITAALAPQVGLAVSLKFTEDHSSLSASSSSWVDDASGLRATVHNTTALKLFMGQLMEPVEEGSKQGPPLFDPDLVLGDIVGSFNNSIDRLSVATTSVQQQLESFLEEFASASSTTWDKYVELLPAALSKIQVRPFFQSLESCTDVAVPDSMPLLSQTLDEFALSFQFLRNATRQAKELPSRGENFTYGQASKLVTDIKENMDSFHNEGKTGADALNLLFQQLIKDALENPIFLQLPGVIVAPFMKMLGNASRVAHRVEREMCQTFTKVSETVGKAGNDALRNLKQDLLPESQSGASRVAPLLAAMVAVGAAAFL